MKPNLLFLAAGIGAWSCAGVTVVAQPTVDIGLYPGAPGCIELRITPDSDFNGLLSALSFTLGRTDDGGGRQMTLEQTDAMRQLVALGPSGGEHIVGTERYRIFSGIGMSTLASIGQVWKGGISYTVATLRATEAEQPHIINDDWARDRAHNGAFYLSLNGLDRTGRVVAASVADEVEHALSLSVTPNPWSAGPIYVDVRGAEQGAVRLDLVDIGGRVMSSRTIETHEPVFRSVLRPETAPPAGTYLLSVIAENSTKSTPLVVIEHER